MEFIPYATQSINEDDHAAVREVLDYVEFEPGDFRFIFINPNDASPPAGTCGGGCSCGSR